MRYVIDHDYHIHSKLSSCSEDPNQTPERILKYAQDNGFSSICITDHYWDRAIECSKKWYAEQDFDHISQSKPLPQAEGIKFMFGCENELDMDCKIAMPLSRFDDFDFVLIPTTHLHFKNLTMDEEHFEDPSVKPALWVKRFDALLDLPLPFYKLGIPHMVCSLFHKFDRGEFLSIFDSIPDSEYERVFSRVAEKGCGIEINSHDMGYADSEADTILRPFKIAKSCGCKFFLGSDAHDVGLLNRCIPYFERAIDALDLKESDKFHIVK